MRWSAGGAKPQRERLLIPFWTRPAQSRARLSNASNGSRHTRLPDARTSCSSYGAKTVLHRRACSARKYCRISRNRGSQSENTKPFLSRGSSDCDCCRHQCPAKNIAGSYLGVSSAHSCEGIETRRRRRQTTSSPRKQYGIHAKTDRRVLQCSRMVSRGASTASQNGPVREVSARSG